MDTGWLPPSDCASLDRLLGDLWISGPLNVERPHGAYAPGPPRGLVEHAGLGFASFMVVAGGTRSIAQSCGHLSPGTQSDMGLAGGGQETRGNRVLAVSCGSREWAGSHQGAFRIGLAHDKIANHLPPRGFMGLRP